MTTNTDKIYIITTEQREEATNKPAIFSAAIGHLLITYGLIYTSNPVGALGWFSSREQAQSYLDKALAPAVPDAEKKGLKVHYCIVEIDQMASPTTENK